MAERFYVTTPIYYVNAPVHLGHVYCSTACDVLARWHRLAGHDTFFLTGLDEHGGNIEKVAQEHGVTPQAWCDRIAGEDRAVFTEMGISNDDFIRTTEDRHRRATEAFWKAVVAGKAPDGKPNISKGEYQGLYCSKCEAFYLEGDVVDGLCPVHQTPVEKLKEETYFFHLSGYQQHLAEFFEAESKKPANERFVVPETRFNEVRGLLHEGLRDVSISRTKIGWGFPVPGDPAHVIYVWFDALINYLTVLGYPDTSGPRWSYWPANVHVIGKEIMRFHALLWPAMLEAAGLPKPRRVVAHGWWLVEGDKMSKSTGNVVDPVAYAREFSLDAVRHFLLAEKGFGTDGDFSRRRFIERYNTDLANIFGNLSHRTISMAQKYFAAKVPRPAARSNLSLFLPPETALADQPNGADMREQLMNFVAPPMAIPDFQVALENLWTCFRCANKYIDDRAPWKQSPEDQAVTLGNVLELLEAASWPLLAFMPEKAVKLRAMLGLPANQRAPLPEIFTLVPGDPLFPRFETKPKPNAPKA